MSTTDELIPSVYAETQGPLLEQVQRAVGGDRDLATDIVQETWLRAIRAWRATGIPERPAAWLGTVSRHLVLNEFRRQRRHRTDTLSTVVEIEDTSDAVNIGALIESQEQRDALDSAMAQLTGAEAELLRQFYEQRLSLNELAGDMAISARAVEGRLRRARQRLRLALEIHRPDRSTTRRLGHVIPTGVSGGTPYMQRAATMTALLPFLAILAFAPFAFLVRRISRYRLGMMRIAAGVALFALSTFAVDDASRTLSSRLLQLLSVIVVLWGVWMVRTPDRSAAMAS